MAATALFIPPQSPSQARSCGAAYCAGRLGCRCGVGGESLGSRHAFSDLAASGSPGGGLRDTGRSRRHGAHFAQSMTTSLATPSSPPCAGDLHARLRTEGERFPDPTRVRLHRAISWLRRAERESTDDDARFIFHWVAFNAAYAREVAPEESERTRFSGFFDLLVQLDSERRLHALLFKQFTGPIRTLVDNKFVFEPFWKALRDHDAHSDWEQRFANGRKAALAAVMAGDTAKVLGIVFDRLYVLRNQLLHGGATWNSGVNRAQVADGARILAALVPATLALMLEHPGADYGDILYPVV